MGTRRKAREAGLQLLFQLEGQLDGLSPDALDVIINRFFENFDAPVRTHEYAELLARHYVAHRGDIDARVQRNSPRWKLERMSRVDRNVLRLALAELLFETEPEKVVLDEAIEIARRFGTEESSKFVNGVLDAALKERRAEEKIA